MRASIPAALIAVSCVLGAREGRPDVPPIAVAASFGWASPVGSAERGGRLRDTTFGMLPLELDVAYGLLPALGITAHVQYGIGVPTLCQTAADCTASLGTDVEAVLGVRWHLPWVGPVAPLVDWCVGYEWFTARFADAGAQSTRSYRGPVLASLRFAAPFRLGPHWTLGPLVDASAGTFTAQSLEGSAFSISRDVPARAVHGWIQVGLRLEFSPRTQRVR